ncbi:MAG: MBL fold metallo-hydrolase [Clostridiales bacterium]|jgi:phosphoribosyl 1,2-cyclic phosphodiesterase|nr:MBL fold metallo-hydrolase [Clostridiales bacterium]
MSIKMCSLSSGSTGNCIYVAGEKTELLIDCGIPLSRVRKSLRVLGASAEGIPVLVTHSHGDHINGIGSLVRSAGAVVYSHYRSTPAVARAGRLDKTNYVEYGDGEFRVGDLVITPVPVPHDVPCVGFVIREGAAKACVFTDLGRVTPEILEAAKGAAMMIIEANHDPALVASSAYARFLKNRILSPRGHLSNDACADAIAGLVGFGLRRALLAHLSRENNSPELALRSVADRLFAAGIRPDADVTLEVAPAAAMSGLYRIG